ncbi:hypothetical protein T10_5095 [Trichinella papuae]|uniref:Uncharacterized protein n=1 Tax=Trichinella papuae TaxID=268474 RepID=A0A0V1MC09_9BILA|nr:hypothetical protein T10_5095 [Trichinella papuae]
MSSCTENSFEFKNSGTFQNSVLIFNYKFKKANGMFQRIANDLFIVLLITKYNIMQDIVPYVNSAISREIRNLATCDQKFRNFVAIAFAVFAFCVKKRFSKCFDGYGF